jgi:hypothetical protein
LDYVKLELFKILRKIIKVNYKLNLPAKIKIYLVQYIAILELAYREHELLLYKADMYRGHKKDEWEI